MRTDLGLLAALERGCHDSAGDVLLIHSQPEHGFALTPAPGQDTRELHLQAIRYLAGERDLWFWANSPGFVELGRFDVLHDASDDPLAEFVRPRADWRTAAPVGSIVGIGSPPQLDPRAAQNPLGTGSQLHELVSRRGLVLTYGCGLEATRLLHYCETQAPHLPYRYPEQVTGDVLDEKGHARVTTVELLVAPPHRDLTYDWSRLETDLVSADAAMALRADERTFLLLSAPDVADFVVTQLTEDPLYLLTAECRNWVEPLLAQLGRGFRPEDFAEVSPSH